MAPGLSARELVDCLKAAGENTRLRILALLLGGELNVKDLTRVLGQSQPRISRHLKLLVEAGLIERYREGSWVWFRLGDGLAARQVERLLRDNLDADDRLIERDRARSETVKRERADAAHGYFAAHAAEWDEIRALHLPEDAVERAMVDVLTEGRSGRPFELLVDLGTGTGRMLELFAAHARRGLGIDANQAMLVHARARLEGGGHAHCQVRQGDLYDLALPDHEADAVVLHQVLHFLDDPARAVAEAARLLKPGGRLLIADFAAHDLEFLRDQFAHRRLGFSSEQVSAWLTAAGLTIGSRRDLGPSRNAARPAERLTVSLWLGEAPPGTVDVAVTTPRKSRLSARPAEVVR